VSVGIGKDPPPRQQLVQQITAKVVSDILDRFTPFELSNYNENPSRRHSQGGEDGEPPQRTLQKDKTATTMTTKDHHLLLLTSSNEEQELQKLYWEMITTWRAENNYLSANTTNTTTARQLTNNDKDASSRRRQKKSISLYHADTQVEPLLDETSQQSTVASWWHAQVDYLAFWTGQIDPVMNDEILVNVTEYCSLEINRTIESGEFLKQLQLVAAASAAWVDIAFYAVSPVGDESNWDVTTGTSITNDTSSSIKATTHPDPLSLSWGAREWCGLTLCLSTLFLATILSCCAVLLGRRRSKEQTWGAVFTEKGINDLLQVGWKYHQDHHQDGTNDPQLFLQVYDKGKIGYNDDNSILQGGIEQEVIATNTNTNTTVPTSTSAATTMTPPPDSNNTSRDDSSSALPSSTFTSSTPEDRSHQYDGDDNDEEGRKVQVIHTTKKKKKKKSGQTQPDSDNISRGSGVPSSSTFIASTPPEDRSHPYEEEETKVEVVNKKKKMKRKKKKSGRTQPRETQPEPPADERGPSFAASVDVWSHRYKEEAKDPDG
jgi:hypothetical protein